MNVLFRAARTKALQTPQCEPQLRLFTSNEPETAPPPEILCPVCSTKTARNPRSNTAKLNPSKLPSHLSHSRQKAKPITAAPELYR